MEFQLEELETSATEDELAAERAAAQTSTVEAFKRLCAGDFDEYPEQAFFLCGGLEDLEAKAKALREA